MIDKSTGLDLVNAESGYQMNEYLYVTGGDPGEVLHGSINDNRLLAADATLPIPKLTLNRQSLIEKPGVLRFPWGTVITLHSKAMNTPEIVSTIILNDQQKQVIFSNEVEKVSTLKKEGVYFTFPFAVQKPRVEYEGATAWVNPETDMLPGANRQWFTTQGGVRVSSDGVSVAWTSADAPLITLEDINRGLWPDSIQIQSGMLFSYAMNNYWYTDAPAQQGGRFTFRYSLTSGSDLSLAEATRLALEQRSPLTALRHYHMGWPHSLPEARRGIPQYVPCRCGGADSAAAGKSQRLSCESSQFVAASRESDLAISDYPSGGRLPGVSFWGSELVLSSGRHKPWSCQCPVTTSRVWSCE